MTPDILDGDGSVVDENANGKRKSAQRHDVDCLVQETKHYNRRQDGEWNGDGDDECAAPASEKNKDHQAGKSGRDNSFTDDTIDGALNEDRLIGERLNFEVGRKSLRDARQNLPDTLDHIDRRSVPSLEHGHQNPATAVLANDVGLRREPVTYRGHVPKVDRGTSNGLDGQIVQFLNSFRIHIQVDVVFELPHLDRTARQDEVLVTQYGKHIVRGKSLGLQQALVEIDHDLARFSAKGKRNRRSRNCHQLGAQEVQRNVVELRFGEILARQAELKNGNGGRAVIQDKG